MRQNLRGRLRPMGIADILDETVEIYKSNFLLLIGIAAVFFVPYFLLTSFIESQSIHFGNTAYFAGNIINALIKLFFYLIVLPFVTGAMTIAISDRYLQKETTIADCFKQITGGGLWWSLLGANILVFLIACLAFGIPIGMIAIGIWAYTTGGFGIAIGVIVILAAIAGILLAVHIMMRMILVAPSLVIEKTSAFNSLARSWNLMHGNVLKGLAVVVIVAIVVSILEAIIVAPLSILIAVNGIQGTEPSMLFIVLLSLLSMIAGTILQPASSIANILIYYDARIRKEGFDLELLANELSEATMQFGTLNCYDLPQENDQQQENTQEKGPYSDNP